MGKCARWRPDRYKRKLAFHPQAPPVPLSGRGDWMAWRIDVQEGEKPEDLDHRPGRRWKLSQWGRGRRAPLMIRRRWQRSPLQVALQL